MQWQNVKQYIMDTLLTIYASIHVLRFYTGKMKKKRIPTQFSKRNIIPQIYIVTNQICH